MSLLNIILGANMSSRLFDEVREKRGLVYDIHSSVKRYSDTGALTISAGVEHKKVQKAIRVVLDELAKIKKNGVKKIELTRAKEYMRCQMLMGLEDTMEHMSWMGEKLMSEGKVNTSEQILARMNKVKLEDLQSVARSVFRDSGLRIAAIGPFDDAASKQIGKLLHIGG